MKTTIPWAAAVLLSLGGLTVADEVRAQADNQGFLYGTVETRSGRSYTGFLRWGDEEAFWDDLFHSAKKDLPYMEELEDMRGERRGKRNRIRILGYKIDWNSGDSSSSRVFIARFGDIESIRVTGDDDAEVRMKSGELYDVSGYANDVGAQVRVDDEDLGEIELRWKRIDTIEFKPVPRGANPGVFRLHGTVYTDSGDFTGYIQWDSEECLSTDLLDGESEDGDISIEMGRIAVIERRGRRSCIVELRDGRDMRLRGTNDVNDEIRGIMVDDPELGRVKIPWDEFDRAVFSEAGPSGPGYDDYRPGARLEGTVTDIDGETYSGTIVFDLDESEDWEILNGSYRDVEYNIPFRLIESIRPEGDDASLVRLRGGKEVELEDGQDVSGRNDGLLVFEDGDEDPVYLPWDDIDEIHFDR